MPAVLRLRQRLIIEVFVLGDFRLQRNIFSHKEPTSVEKKRRQKTAHSAVAIVEWMDAEKIMDKHRNHQERLDFHIADHAVVLRADGIQRLRRFVRRQRRKKELWLPVRPGGGDIILDVLDLTSHWIVHLAVENFVQLQNNILRDRNGIKILMNDRQRVTVTRDFLLVAVSGRGFFLDQLFDTRARRHDPLNGVGAFRALNLCDLHKLFQLRRTLLQIQLLLASLFVNRRNQPKHLRIPLLIPKRRIMKRSHTLTSIFFP